jgi:hypothetical protein
MSRSELAREIIATYRKHGWEPRRALLRETSQDEVSSVLEGQIEIAPAPIDAIWFSRPSSNQREAWELRLIEESPYALFETFPADLSEEERERLRKEMEERARQRGDKSP